jgi:hypothetical protein
MVLDTLIKCFLVKGMYLFGNHFHILGLSEVYFLFTRLDKALKFIYIAL